MFFCKAAAAFLDTSKHQSLLLSMVFFNYFSFVYLIVLFVVFLNNLWIKGEIYLIGGSVVALDEATGAGVELLHAEAGEFEAPCLLILNRLASFDRREDIQADADSFAFTKQLILLRTG